MNQQAKQQVTYREKLPDNCPPIDANIEDEFLIMRMAKIETPTQACFHSKAALGEKARGDITLCELASCSCFRAQEPDDFRKAIAKLPRFKKHFTHVFFLTTSKKIGKYKINPKSSHVDVWFYSDFDPVLAVTEVRPI